MSLLWPVLGVSILFVSDFYLSLNFMIYDAQRTEMIMQFAENACPDQPVQAVQGLRCPLTE